MEAFESAKMSALRASQALAERARRALECAENAWREEKPRTPLGWTTFVGLALLSLAVASSVLVALSGTLIALCWAGVAAYTFLVSMATLGVLFVGGATLLFSGTCAMCGCAVLMAAGYAYVAAYLYKRFKASAAICYAWWATLPTTDSPGVTGPRRVSPRPPAVGSAPAGKLAPQADPSRTPATPAERGQQGSRTDGPSLVTSNEAAPSVTVGSQTLAPLKCTAASASKPGTPAVPDQPRQCSDQRGSVKVEDAVQQQQEEEERLDVPGAGGSLTAAAAVRQLVTAA